MTPVLTALQTPTLQSLAGINVPSDEHIRI
jgi:hypothetical protein